VVFEVTEAVVVNKVKAPALVLNDGFEEEFLEDDEEEFSVGLVKEEAAVLETIPQKGIVLQMPSRKLRVNIARPLLLEIERLDLPFSIS
jgi:hypothetical protein